MEAQSQNRMHSRLHTFIGNAPTLVGAVSALCYVMGLLITNLHLATFGVYSVELFRGEYLLAGAVLIFLVSITWTSLQYAINSTRIRYALNKSASRNLHLAVRVVVMVVGFIFLEREILKTVAVSKFVSISGGWWAGVLILSLFSGVFELLRGDVIGKRPIVGPSQVLPSPMHSSIEIDSGLVEFIRGTPLILPALSLGIMLSVLQLYVEHVYPHVRGAYGGGAKNSAYLMPTPRGVEIGETFSLPFSRDKKLIGPLEMLSESDAEMIVLIENELIPGKKIAVRLAKSDFDAAQSRPAE